MITFYKLRQIDENVDKIEEAKTRLVFDEVDRIFTNWRAVFLLEVLSRYLNWVRNPDNRFIPDFLRVGHALLRLNLMGSTSVQVNREYRGLSREWKREFRKMVNEEASLSHYRFNTAVTSKD